jgi:hypothetical protein
MACMSVCCGRASSVTWTALLLKLAAGTRLLVNSECSSLALRVPCCPGSQGALIGPGCIRWGSMHCHYRYAPWPPGIIRRSHGIRLWYPVPAHAALVTRWPGLMVVAQSASPTCGRVGPFYASFTPVMLCGFSSEKRVPTRLAPWEMRSTPCNPLHA